MLSLALTIVWWGVQQAQRLGRPILWLVVAFALVTLPFQIIAFVVSSCALFGVHVPAVELIDYSMTLLLPYTTGHNYKSMGFGASLLQVLLSVAFNALALFKSTLLMIAPSSAVFNAINTHIELDAYKRASQIWNDSAYELFIAGVGYVLSLFNSGLLRLAQFAGDTYPHVNVVVSSGVYLVLVALLFLTLRYLSPALPNNRAPPTPPYHTPSPATIQLVFQGRPGGRSRSRSFGAVTPGQSINVDEFSSVSNTQ